MLKCQIKKKLLWYCLNVKIKLILIGWRKPEIREYDWEVLALVIESILQSNDGSGVVLMRDVDLTIISTYCTRFTQFELIILVQILTF